METESRQTLTPMDAGGNEENGKDEGRLLTQSSERRQQLTSEHQLTQKSRPGKSQVEEQVPMRRGQVESGCVRHAPWGGF